MTIGDIVAKPRQSIAAALLLASTFISGLVAAQVMPVRPVPLHVPTRLVVPDARLPVRLESVLVQAEVLGAAAHTRIEMVFYNPNLRPLEGELQFPLLDGQTVTGIALDIDGELRSAVPVEKVKGQQVFEDVARAEVDPALLEKTQGNNYKLRVYPLPAKGTRRVVLELDEMLSRNSSGGSTQSVYYTGYRLPLQFAETVEQLDVTVHNAALPGRHSAMAVRALLGAERIKVSYEFDKEPHTGSRVSFSRRKFTGKGLLTVDFPRVQTSLMATETRDGQTYFYAEVPALLTNSTPRVNPKTVALVWDASGSGLARDHGRELALLDAYFKALKDVKIELLVVRDQAEAPQFFAVKNGDWRLLRAELEQMVYDGASSAIALSPGHTADLTLMFSDGLSNYGAGQFEAGDAPLYAVNAAVMADVPRLRAMAEKSGGRLLDLLATTPVQAVTELTHRYPRLLGLHSNGAKDLVSTSIYPEANLIKIAGILTEPKASIELDWLNAQDQHQLQQVTVQNGAKVGPSLAASRWVSLKIAQLEADYAANRSAIRQLGQRFGRVTRETSLIVLDRVEDYVRYEIAPPASLRVEYEAQQAQKMRQLSDERHDHLEDIAKRFAQKVAWWERGFPKGDMPQPAVHQDTSAGERTGMSASAPVPVATAMAMAPPPVPVAMLPAAAGAASASISAAAAAPARIELKKWQSDAPYAQRLRDVAAEQMYRVYLDERPAYANSTAFFLDVADVFMERGQVSLGLRILSNLAEMNLENRQILRILAYRLLQAKQAQLALPILQQVVVLNPNEPQSWRDLGLAYAQDGQYQRAVDNLWEVVARPWHNRFPDIELIALGELNAIVAQAAPASAVDTSRFDERLMRNLPLAVRAVLSWDADNTDIDLWVTDPNNEKVYYGHRLGYQGGSMSRDFTRGYGPEEYSLRQAKPGKYKVQAHFYGNRQQIIAGATTLMLRLSTGFGSAQQKDDNIILRLSGQGAVVDVGTFEVGNVAP